MASGNPGAVQTDKENSETLSVESSTAEIDPSQEQRWAAPASLLNRGAPGSQKNFWITKEKAGIHQIPASQEETPLTRLPSFAWSRYSFARRWRAVSKASRKALP